MYEIIANIGLIVIENTPNDLFKGIVAFVTPFGVFGYVGSILKELHNSEQEIK